MSEPVSRCSAKKNLAVLDALRGVCAIVVVALHFSENYSTPGKGSWLFPHGCLPVEFFFILTGFMLVYAYDDRWGAMSFGSFVKRRLVRLHPLVIFGSIVGAACYLLASAQYSRQIPGGELGLGGLAVLTLWCCTMLPAPASRGWALLHPLQGPLWTMFYIYVANALYALVLRHLKTWALAFLAVVSIAFTYWVGVRSGGFHSGPGWSWSHWRETGLMGVLCSGNMSAVARMSFPLFAGMTIARKGWCLKTGNAGLWICIAILFSIFCAPNFRPDHLLINGFLESTAVVIGMPLVLLCGVGGEIRNETFAGVCRFLGKFSFPLYTTHYSMTMVERVWRDAHSDAPWEMHLAVTLACVFFAVLNALVAMRFADWCSARFQKRMIRC